jgi:ascorbate PTS system EIIA or EIIAB component
MDGRVTLDVAVTARVAVDAPDWRAAIRAACRPLVDAGAFEDRYVNQCIANVVLNGPYIVLAPGIALAHARPQDGVRTLGLGVAALARPVAFGHPKNDPVDVVIAFGSPDKESHTGMLAALAKHLLAGLSDRIRGAGSAEEATALLKEVVSDASRDE